MNKCLKFSIIIIITLLNACQPVPQMMGSTKLVSNVSTSSLLWEISGKDLKQPSYLFGTLHIISKEKFFMPPTLQQTFSKTNQLIMEIDLSDPNFQKESLRYVDMPNNQRLHDLVDEKEFKTIETFFADSLELGVSVFSRWKPLWLSNITLNKVYPKEAMSYEMFFVDLAKKDKKSIMALETIQYQMEMFDNVPFDQQAQILVNNIEKFEEVRSMYYTLEDIYLQKDVDLLYQFSLDNMEDFRRFEDILIVQRNRNWIPRITKYIRGSSSFIAVGAGHLGGKNGLIPLLKAKGYTVKPIIL